MSGVIVLRSVLTADPGVTALIPAAQIIGDIVAPQELPLPVILLKQVSLVDRKTLVVGPDVMATERVQCEIYAKDADNVREIKRAVRNAVRRNSFPAVDGLSNVTLHTEGEGPDFIIPDAAIRVGEQDFKVTYSEDIS